MSVCVYVCVCECSWVWSRVDGGLGWEWGYRVHLYSPCNVDATTPLFESKEHVSLYVQPNLVMQGQLVLSVYKVKHSELTNCPPQKKEEKRSKQQQQQQKQTKNPRKTTKKQNTTTNNSNNNNKKHSTLTTSHFFCLHFSLHLFSPPPPVYVCLLLSPPSLSVCLPPSPPPLVVYNPYPAVIDYLLCTWMQLTCHTSHIIKYC